MIMRYSGEKFGNPIFGGALKELMDYLDLIIINAKYLSKKEAKRQKWKRNK